MPKPQTVLISQIDLADTSSQVRSSTNQELVQAYLERLRDGDGEPPPVDLFSTSGKPPYLIGDGWHRVLAAQGAGRINVQARIHHGGLEEALLVAWKANEGHGLSLTNPERSKAIIRLLKLPSIKKLSAREANHRLGVPLTTILRYRKKLDFTLQGAPVARAQDQDRQAVSDFRHNSSQMSPTGNSQHVPESEAVTAAHGDAWEGGNGAVAPPPMKRIAEDQDVDALGTPIPKHLRDYFYNEALFAAIRHLQQALILFRSIAQWNPFLAGENTPQDCSATGIELVGHALPYAVCQLCQGDKVFDDEPCPDCLACGWLPEWKFKDLERQAAARVPEEV